MYFERKRGTKRDISARNSQMMCGFASVNRDMSTYDARRYGRDVLEPSVRLGDRDHRVWWRAGVGGQGGGCTWGLADEHGKRGLNGCAAC